MQIDRAISMSPTYCIHPCTPVGLRKSSACFLLGMEDFEQRPRSIFTNPHINLSSPNPSQYFHQFKIILIINNSSH